MSTSTNALQRPQERPQASPRWIEVLAPSYRIQSPSSPSQRLVPRWLQWTREHDAAKEIGQEVTR